jgi:hypothetical protein
LTGTTGCLRHRCQQPRTSSVSPLPLLRPVRYLAAGPRLLRVFEISSPRALRTTGIGLDSWYELAQGRSRWRAAALRLRHLTSPDKTKLSGTDSRSAVPSPSFSALSPSAPPLPPTQPQLRRQPETSAPPPPAVDRGAARCCSLRMCRCWRRVCQRLTRHIVRTRSMAHVKAVDAGEGHFGEGPGLAAVAQYVKHELHVSSYICV